MKITHHDLLVVAKPLRTDYEPMGRASRDIGDRDCSCGCRFFVELRGNLGADWGICASGFSPRRGLLTFEHQGGKTCFERVKKEIS